MSEAERFYSVLVPAVIPNGTAVTAAIRLDRAANGKVLMGLRPVGILMPAAWTTANLTFQAGVDDQTPANMYDMYGVEYNVVAAASVFITLKAMDFIGANTLIVRSGTSGTPVNQAAERTLQLVLRQL